MFADAGVLPATGPSRSEQPEACTGVPKSWQGPLALEFSSGKRRAVLSLLVRHLRCRTLLVGMGNALLDRLFAGGAPGRLHVDPAQTAEPGPGSTQRGLGLCWSQRGGHHLEGCRWRGGVSTSRSGGLVKSRAPSPAYRQDRWCRASEAVVREQSLSFHAVVPAPGGLASFLREKIKLRR
ncbi:unnamed protein product [Symbiodinium necroappetens]|uniref:Uncharacterized protein n=1 Tax=Symbiodinium necroappetens TaxID=1628268 RepID=A0A812Q5Z4_9DINO|nr:unnamed protein product [Symbiodinium necroappetens]